MRPLHRIETIVICAAMDDVTQQRSDAPPAKAKAARRRPRAQRPSADINNALAVRIPGLAQALNIGVTSAKELVTSGRIRSVKVGSTRLIPVTEIKKFLEK